MEQQKIQREYSTIPKEIVDVTRKRNLKHDSLASFLRNEYGTEVANTLVQKYNITAAKNGTLLWYQDKTQQFRTGQVLQIDFINGVVRAEEPKLVHEVFAETHGLDFKYSGCCFGDHQAVEAFFLTKGLVSDPLLAIVLSTLISDVTWFSVPVKSTFDIKGIVSGYKESQFFLFPDGEQYVHWAEALEGVDQKAIILSNQLVDLYPLIRKDGLQKNSSHMQNAVSRIKSVITDAVPF